MWGAAVLEKLVVNAQQESCVSESRWRDFPADVMVSILKHCGLRPFLFPSLTFKENI